MVGNMYFWLAIHGYSPTFRPAIDHRYRSAGPFGASANPLENPLQGQ